MFLVDKTGVFNLDAAVGVTRLPTGSGARIHFGVSSHFDVQTPYDTVVAMFNPPAAPAQVHTNVGV